MEKLFFRLWLSVAALLFLGSAGTRVQAQQDSSTKLEMIDFSEAEFVPHWQIGLQGGVAHDLGEAPFYKLLSPALQLTGEYRLHPLFGVRAAVSGFWARNRYVYPKRDYKWYFVQPSVELKVDLASLFFGWVPDQPVSPYLFAGVGLCTTFDNSDAKGAKNEIGSIAKSNEFAKLWDGSRWNAVFRGGLGADFYINDRISIGAEVNANLLPDHFNSKQGEHDNKDWHFNALVGLKVNLGKTHRGNEPIFQSVRVMQLPKEPIIRDTVALQVNIQFIINQSVLRSSEFGKLNQMLTFLKTHPRSHVEMTGYADRLTGTPTINQRLSVERARAVGDWLVARGISPERVYKDAKGDRVQPFPVNEDNRVTVCFVVDILD